MLTITVLALVPPAITSRPANLLPDVDPGPSSFQLPTPWAMANGNRTKPVGQNLFVPSETPWKRKIFFVLGQSNANGRGNAARLTENDQRRLAKVADRVILTYRGGISWPRVTPKEWVGEHGFWEAFGTRALRVPLGPLPMDRTEQQYFGFNQSFGPELFMGIALAEAMPDELLHIVKVAVPGVSMYGQWNPKFTSDKCCSQPVYGGRCDGRPDMEWKADGVGADEEFRCEEKKACATAKTEKDKRLCEFCCAAYKPINDEQLGFSCSASDGMRVALYPTLVRDAQMLVERGGELAGWVWVGGERDLCCPQEYLQAFSDFVRSLRQDLQARLPGALFCPQDQRICAAHQKLASTLSDLMYYQGEPPRKFDEIRPGEEGYEDARRVIEFGKHHYDYAGQKQLGESAGQLLLRMMSPS